MTKKLMFMLPVVSFLMTGCASIMSGTDQDIAMHTNPEGAECILTREGQQLRKVVTPDNVRVSKLKHDIYVKCSMKGFHDSTAHINSGTQGSVFGNILLGGGIGWAIDSARGADNKYADVVTVPMVPLAQVAPESVVVGVDGTVLKKSEAEALSAAEKLKKEEKAGASEQEMTTETVADATVTEEKMEEAIPEPLENSKGDVSHGAGTDM
ncbi:MAG: hypothetical protein JKY45_10980 [Emcibacter sp.]|nr:hypothetical protein [Emcibacter sp.]